jgi:kynurenine formamidase
MRIVLVLIASILAGCAATPRSVDPAIDRFIDLTWPFDAQTLYWPGGPGFELTRVFHGVTAGGFFIAVNKFCAPEHGGTHVDAPLHFGQGRRSVDQIPLEQLIAAAVVIDVSAKAAADRDYRLTVDDIREWESRNGSISRGSIVLLRTGWAKYWPDRKAYFGDDRPGATDALHFPSYGAEAARILVEERGVGALGIDTASVDFGQSRDFAVHRVSAPSNVVNLENLANLDQLPERGAIVIALPMKISGGTGGPARVVAIVKK